MSDDEQTSVQREADRIFIAKKAWHQRQSQLPLKEKVRILLRIQQDDYPILLRRGVLRSWEKPWKIDP
jgi:hypothetical protein